MERERKRKRRDDVQELTAEDAKKWRKGGGEKRRETER